MSVTLSAWGSRGRAVSGWPGSAGWLAVKRSEVVEHQVPALPGWPVGWPHQVGIRWGWWVLTVCRLTPIREGGRAGGLPGWSEGALRSESASLTLRDAGKSGIPPVPADRGHCIFWHCIHTYTHQIFLLAHWRGPS